MRTSALTLLAMRTERRHRRFCFDRRRHHHFFLTGRHGGESDLDIWLILFSEGGRFLTRTTLPYPGPFRRQLPGPGSVVENVRTNANPFVPTSHFSPRKYGGHGRGRAAEEGPDEAAARVRVRAGVHHEPGGPHIYAAHEREARQQAAYSYNYYMSCFARCVAITGATAESGSGHDVEGERAQGHEG